MVNRPQLRILNPAIESCLGPWGTILLHISASQPYYGARYGQKHVFSMEFSYLRFYWTNFHWILWATWYRHYLFVEYVSEFLVHFWGEKVPLNFSSYRLNMMFWSEHPNKNVWWCIRSPFWRYIFFTIFEGVEGMENWWKLDFYA